MPVSKIKYRPEIQDAVLLKFNGGAASFLFVCNSLMRQWRKGT